jgi:hypothetical protein
MGKRFCTLFIMVLSAVGCGTTHHFLPANPLPRNQSQVSVNWHYDFDGSLRGLIVPEASFYGGIGGNWNCGIGIQIPFRLTHVSFVKYSSDTVGSDWMGYVSVNQIMLSGNDNPYLEVGAMHIDRVRTYAHEYGAGLALGNGLCNPLWTLLNSKPNGDSKSLSHLRLLPLIRYQVIGRDLGVSYVHYHGKTKRSYAEIIDGLRYHNDTVCVLPAGTVDSMAALQSILEHGRYFELYGLFLTSKDTIVLAGREIMVCGMPLLFGFNPEEGEPNWKKLGLTRLKVFRLDGHSAWMTSAKDVFLSISDLRKKAVNHERIVITSYDPVVTAYLNGLNNIKLDHSIGISTFYYPKEESK